MEASDPCASKSKRSSNALPTLNFFYTYLCFHHFTLLTINQKTQDFKILNYWPYLVVLQVQNSFNVIFDLTLLNSPWILPPKLNRALFALFQLIKLRLAVSRRVWGRSPRPRRAGPTSLGAPGLAQLELKLSQLNARRPAMFYLKLFLSRK